jgi:hypothetical protein
LVRSDPARADFAPRVVDIPTSQVKQLPHQRPPRAAASRARPEGSGSPQFTPFRSNCLRPLHPVRLLKARPTFLGTAIAVSPRKASIPRCNGRFLMIGDSKGCCPRREDAAGQTNGIEWQLCPLEGGSCGKSFVWDCGLTGFTPEPALLVADALA